MIHPFTETFATLDWDQGRLRVNRRFASLLQEHQLTTFESLFRYAGGEVAKHVIAERPTTRVTLKSGADEVVLYLKRHTPAKWKEYLKPLIRLRWPRLGARPEWDAILKFQELGIPTMVPVAVGQRGRESLLLTLAIEGCEKLSDWMKRHVKPVSPQDLVRIRLRIAELATLTRKMHGAGLHHQDFYAGHILLPHDHEEGIHILDLGRVRATRRLAQFWIIKDLAQLHYSTPWFTRADGIRFLQAYLGRSCTTADRFFIQKILRKSTRIARHSKKHGL